MIDQFMTWRGNRKDTLLDWSYTPDQAVLGMDLSGPENATRLDVLLPPWHGGGKAYEKLTHRLVEMGHAVLNVHLNDHILGPYIDQTLESMDNVEEVVSDELFRLVDKNGYTEIEGTAASLGNVPFAKIAQRFGGFTGATMLVAGSNIARSTWEGDRTQEIRKLMEILGINEEILDADWDPIAPKTNASALKGVPVNLIMSQPDNVIPYKYQAEMANELLVAGAKVSVDVSYLGHYSLVGAYCYFGNLK
jgi:hypothetical protein